MSFFKATETRSTTDLPYLLSSTQYIFASSPGEYAFFSKKQRMRVMP